MQNFSNMHLYALCIEVSAKPATDRNWRGRMSFLSCTYLATIFDVTCPHSALLLACICINANYAKYDIILLLCYIFLHMHMNMHMQENLKLCICKNMHMQKYFELCICKKYANAAEFANTTMCRLVEFVPVRQVATG